MTIASEITRINNNIASAYTAVNNKGGTLPATQNSANLATSINSIPTGITPTGTIQITQNGTYNVTNYATANVNIASGYTELPSYQVLNGVASRRSGTLTGNEFSNITSVGSYGLYYAFKDCTGLTGSLNLSSLTGVNNRGLYYAFNGCTGLTGVDLSSLTSVAGYGLYYAFYDCTGLTGVDLSSLTSVGNNGLAYAFSGCTGLTNIYFNSLTTTSFGSYTNQFNSMLSSTGKSKRHTLHFPSNLESTIQGLSGYPTFGGTSGYVVLAFDLPATS